jgi:hypothetical protein
MFAPKAVQHHTPEPAPQGRPTAEVPMPSASEREAAPFLQRYLGNSYVQSQATGDVHPPKRRGPGGRP